MIYLPDQFTTHTLSTSAWGNAICQVLASAMNGAEAGSAISKYLSIDNSKLIINKSIYDLNNFRRIIVIGAGKASLPMAAAVHSILGNWITSGVVITKTGYNVAYQHEFPLAIKIFETSHPVPDQRNLRASSTLISLVNNLDPEDLAICLISGGGSSLLLKLPAGITLRDVQQTITLLLSCGASIGEINTIRKHLDMLKGGGLAKTLFPAAVLSLILSDVVGDALDRVASGPTVADPTTYRDAWKVLEKYEIIDQVPNHVIDHLSMGIQGKLSETVKPGDPILSNIQNVLIGNNTQTVQIAIQSARELGFISRVLTTTLQGEASKVGQSLVENAISEFSLPEFDNVPACLIAGGETTVTLKGNGMGGRNQELALSTVRTLSGSDPLILISLATDGADGPTGAAGAVVSNQSYSRGLSLGLNPIDYLANNDSYHYFEPLGDLIITGPTLTNTNDLVFIFRS